MGVSPPEPTPQPAEAPAGSRTLLERIAGWARSSSLRTIVFEGIGAPAGLSDLLHDEAGLVCDSERESSPRQADLLVVAGRIGLRTMPVVQRIWQQMSEPKWCLLIDAGAHGQIDTYALVPDPSAFLPVDVRVDGSREAIRGGFEAIRRLASGGSAPIRPESASPPEARS